MTSYDVIPAFATPIYVTSVPELTEEHRAYMETLPFDDSSGFVQSANRRILNDPTLVDLKNALTGYAKFYATEIYAIQTKTHKDDFEFYIKNSWVYKMDKGYSFPKHYHANSIFTGVLYVNVDTNSGHITFERETPNWDTRPYGFAIKQHNIYNSDFYSYRPKVRDLIIFPSRLNHFSAVNDSAITRYSLAFDVYIKGHMSLGQVGETFFKDDAN